MLDSLFRIVGAFGFVGIVISASVLVWRGLVSFRPNLRNSVGDGLGAFLTVVAVPVMVLLIVWLISIAPNQEDFVSAFGFALTVVALPIALIWLAGWSIMRLRSR